MTTGRSLGLLFLLSSFPNAIPAQKPDTLVDKDLAIARLTVQSDTADARRVLGSPAQIKRPASTGPYRTFEIWEYATLTFTFAAGKIDLIEVRDRSFATNRGARVGDGESRIRALYGRPVHADTASLAYVRSFGPTETRGIMFRLKSGRVTEIMIGNVFGALD